jgi:hypothetical protein
MKYTEQCVINRRMVFTLPQLTGCYIQMQSRFCRSRVMVQIPQFKVICKLFKTAYRGDYDAIMTEMKPKCLLLFQ